MLKKSCLGPFVLGKFSEITEIVMTGVIFSLESHSTWHLRTGLCRTQPVLLDSVDFEKPTLLDMKHPSVDLSVLSQLVWSEMP